MVRQITNIFHAIGQLALEIELIGKVKKIELVRFLMKLCCTRWLYFLVRLVQTNSEWSISGQGVLEAKRLIRQVLKECYLLLVTNLYPIVGIEKGKITQLLYLNVAYFSLC